MNILINKLIELEAPNEWIDREEKTFTATVNVFVASFDGPEAAEVLHCV